VRLQKGRSCGEGYRSAFQNGQTGHVSNNKQVSVRMKLLVTERFCRPCFWLLRYEQVDGCRQRAPGTIERSSLSAIGCLNGQTDWSTATRALIALLHRRAGFIW
jgi:hypothetical protein